MRPLRICYVIGSLDVGGTETQLVGLAPRLDGSRFKPYICCLAKEGEMFERVRKMGIELAVFSPHRVTLNLEFHWLRRLRSFLIKNEIDVLHGFLFPAYSLASLAARWAHTPVVVAGHRALGVMYELQWPYNWLERIGHRYTHHIVANSEAVRRASLKRDPGIEAKITVIHNGIDSGLYRQDDHRSTVRQELGIADEEVTVMVVANLIRYKGHRVVLGAFELLKRHVPKIKVVLVGYGPEEENLKVLARQLGVETNVLFLGRRDDVPRLLSAADIFALASYQEGFPNSILEAMAAGKPVVATRIGGIPEQVEPGKTGLLVEPGDVEGMARALQDLAQDSNLRARMGQVASERAASDFSWETTVRRHEELYLSLWQRRETHPKGSADGRSPDARSTQLTSMAE